jgi:hypothetical protein
MKDEFGFPPAEEHLTDYDCRYLYIYVQLLDSDHDSVNWKVTFEKIFGQIELKNERLAYEKYRALLKRAEWMVREGYRELM